MCVFNRHSSFVNRKLLLFAYCLCLAPPLHAQSPFTIYGIVRLPDGSPASRATVTIAGPTGLSRQAFTDDTGRYEIPNLPRGRYSLTATNPSDPDQFSELAQVDLSMTTGTRVIAHLYLHHKEKLEVPKEKQSGIISLAEAAQHVPKPAQKAFQQALNLRREQKLDESLKSFGKAIQAFPAYFQAIAERGHLLIAMNRPDDASGDFAKALELNERYGPALRGAGMCRFQQGKHIEAIQFLTRAADAEPGNAMNFLFMGVANLALDQREQARAALLKALSIDPVGANRAHVHLASLSMKENHPREAIREIETYLEAAPNPPDAEKLRAVLAQLRAQAPQN